MSGSKTFEGKGIDIGRSTKKGKRAEGIKVWIEVAETEDRMRKRGLDEGNRKWK